MQDKIDVTNVTFLKLASVVKLVDRSNKRRWLKFYMYFDWRIEHLPGEIRKLILTKTAKIKRIFIFRISTGIFNKPCNKFSYLP